MQCDHCPENHTNQCMDKHSSRSLAHQLDIGGVGAEPRCKCFLEVLWTGWDAFDDPLGHRGTRALDNLAIRARSAEKFPASLLKKRTEPMMTAVTISTTSADSKLTAISFARRSERRLLR